MEFSKEIKEFFKEHYPDKDIYSMSLQELEAFREEVNTKRDEYQLLEFGFKQLGNAAYGAAANHTFYFYNVQLAGDITGECRNLTTTMNKNLEDFFHEEIWKRKDLWEKFDFALDESKHDWYREQHVWVYSDTDSSYTTYGTFFDCFTPEYKEKYKEDRSKIDWILKFNKEFLDGQNNRWCEAIYNPRHGHSLHNFELETISRAAIMLKKKKYLKALSYKKGIFYDHPKISGTGIELVKSTTPELCRTILSDLMKSLTFDTDLMSKEEYILYFNDKLLKYKKEFYTAPVEKISQSIGVGAYKKYVIDDENQLILGKQCPVSVQAVARFNYLAHKNGQDNLKMYSGKIKYYNIRTGCRSDSIGYFGFPAGELPEWAPKVDMQTQWTKNVIDPINRFLEVMDFPLADVAGCIQMTLF